MYIVYFTVNTKLVIVANYSIFHKHFAVARQSVAIAMRPSFDALLWERCKVCNKLFVLTSSVPLTNTSLGSNGLINVS